MTNILITWTSGFIWFHTAKRLLDLGENIIWFDNENDYYDVDLKIARRNILEGSPNFKFYKWSLEHLEELQLIFEENKIEKIIHLAAQWGVRYSITHPFTYIQSNLVGFHNIIELARQHTIKNFIYASSSSVYWDNTKQPSSVDDRADHPISLYAATKKADELIAYSYSHTFGLPTIGLRFFTVYGPWGRPDMAYFSFTRKILSGEAIDVYNNGHMKRDFTYIDDIVDGIIKALNYETHYEIFNLWNDHPEELEHLISYLWDNLWKNVKKIYLPLQDGDVISTRSDIDHTKEKLWWEPKTFLKDGIKWFADRYKSFYNV